MRLSSLDEIRKRLVIEFGDPGFAGRNRHLGQIALGGQDSIDFLLEAIFGDKAMHKHVFALTDAEGAVCGLVFHRGVEPYPGR